MQLLDKLHRGLEIRLGLAGKTDDKIRGDGNIRSHVAQFAKLGFVFENRVVALHGREYPVRTALHR